MNEIEVKIPLDQVMEKRYLKLKKYFEEFIGLVDAAGIDIEEYVAVVSIQKKE